MHVRIHPHGESLAKSAAAQAAALLRERLAGQSQVRIIAATGASQFGFLKGLTSASEIDWARVEMFHLDEYVGLPMTHPASFRKYLLERLIQPAGIGRYHLLDGEGDVPSVCQQVGAELRQAPVDLAFVGIGENGHLAFNDPPADFQTEQPYIVVELDEACRRQQVGEGWFKDLSEVPTQAISMSIRQIMKARKILCIVPDERKAQAVKTCLEGPVSPLAPASILQTHPDVTVFLDTASASLLTQRTRLVHAD
jgi:glucosamine-6-phosphate deaminase